MVENIMKTFEQLHETYNALITYSEEIFYALKRKDFQALKVLNGKQNIENEKVLTLLHELSHEIEQVCEREGIKEVKLSSILSTLSPLERERLVENQTRAFQAEHQFKNNAQFNQVLAEAMMTCSQTIVDTWVHVAQMENKNNSFVNRKL